MRRFVLALALLASGPALAGELELSEAEIKVGFPYVGEYVLPEGEETREILNRGNRSYLNPKYTDDWKKQICVLDFFHHESIAAKKRGDIDRREKRQFYLVISRDRQKLVKNNQEVYNKNFKFFNAIRRGFGDAGIEYCDG